MMLPNANDVLNKANGLGSQPYRTNGSRISRPASSNTGGFEQTHHTNLSSSSTINPERKLKNSLNAISEAFDEKVTDLESQILYWKKHSSTVEKKNKELESTVESLQLSLEKKSNEFSTLSEKHRELLTSQDQLLEKYNQLRKYASKLQEFKKNICNLSGSTSVTIDADIIEQSLAIEDEKLVPKVNGLKSRYPMNDHFTNVYRAKQELHKSTFEPKQPAASRQFLQNRDYPNQITSQELPNSLYDTDEETERISIEDIYTRIMETLNETEFKRFSQTIEDFNSKRISLPMALELFHSMIPDRALFHKMKTLLMANISFQTGTSFQEGVLEMDSDQAPFQLDEPHHQYTHHRH